MTRVTYCGQHWSKITSQAWRDLGGEDNPKLLRLRDRKKPTCSKYFILVDESRLSTPQ